MKYALALGLLCTLGSVAQADCTYTSAKAVMAVAMPLGNSSTSSVYASVSSIDLLSKKGSNLTYKVEIDFDINDGASSDSFPSEVYLVSAEGTEQTCKVTGVQLK